MKRAALPMRNDDEDDAKDDRIPADDGTTASRKRMRQNANETVRSEEELRLLLMQQQQQQIRALSAGQPDLAMNALSAPSSNVSQYLRSQAAAMEVPSMGSLYARNVPSDAELIQELLLRYGAGNVQRLLASSSQDLMSLDPLQYRTLTPPSLPGTFLGGNGSLHAEAQLRLQLAALNASAGPNLSLPSALGSLPSANQSFYTARDRNDFDTTSQLLRGTQLEAQLQNRQNVLRDLVSLQMLDRHPMNNQSWRAGINASSLLDGVMPHVSSMGVDSSSSSNIRHSSSFGGARGEALAAASLGRNTEQYVNQLLAASSPGMARSSPSRSLVAERQQQRLPPPAPAPAKSSKKKAPPVVVEANYDPGLIKDLSLPSDSENLSEYQCLLRQQIVLFAVTLPDIQCSAQGRNKPITLGQVGVLCRHCAKIPPGMRPCGAVYFPAKLSGLYQASQNMAINHFSNNCQSIPEAVRTKLLQLKERKSTVLGGGKHFWANGARVIGVIEHESLLRFAEEGEEVKQEEK